MVSKTSRNLGTLALIGAGAFFLLRNTDAESSGGGSGGGGGFQIFGLGGGENSAGGFGGDTGFGQAQGAFEDFTQPLQSGFQEFQTNPSGEIAVFRQGQPGGVILDAQGQGIASTTRDIFNNPNQKRFIGDAKPREAGSSSLNFRPGTLKVLSPVGLARAVSTTKKLERMEEESSRRSSSSGGGGGGRRFSGGISTNKGVFGSFQEAVSAGATQSVAPQFSTPAPAPSPPSSSGGFFSGLGSFFGGLFR